MKINLNEFMKSELITLKEISDKSEIHLQTLYRIKNTGKATIVTIRKLKDKIPQIINYVEGVTK